ncbi:hypothetical protein DPMN_087865 [Dreissena polymorpha]|uniref:Mab-21-like HhH/H2TH-like domain-containing protein n=1 Tax=Dreissena polymorpha TaxID=45954 RepID=A0A9D4KTZ3_DREPO|nr:hypothetical protein DPMN_087865 [Dreissena polymorpha]
MEDDTIESLSIKLCKVLEDIGVTEELINLNRYVSILRDVLHTSIYTHTHVVIHTFGSQIEGSITLGMHSDIDTLFYLDTLAAYTDVTDRPPSKTSFLAVKTKMSCPQCYSLEFVMPRSGNTLLPANEDVFEISMKKINSKCKWDVLMSDEEGRALLSNHLQSKLLFENVHEFNPNDKIEQHGPAHTINDEKDYVYGIHCSKMPDDCHVLFSRPKPGHWPKQVTTTKAKQCGVFFINPGNIGHTVSYDAERKTVLMNVHYQNKFASSQWRVSTNMIELLLMWDLDIVQMKAYILTKILRKQLLKPIVGDKLSTFHVKTAFLFTVEKYPMEMRNAENLVNCVLFCLKTLRRFLQRRYCPHYSIASVNLFDGKLKCSQFQTLIQELTEIINSGLQCVYTLKTDSLGERLKSFRSTSTIALMPR